MSDRYSPIIDGLGIIPPSMAPAWICTVVQNKRGQKRVALGVLSPGLLTREEAMQLAAKLIEMAGTLSHDGKLST